MKSGFTLLETLLVVLLLSAVATLTLPQWRTLSDYQVLYKEQRRLFAFLRHVQLRTENSAEIWFLLINRDQKESLVYQRTTER